ncbi:MAG: hypothetical protein GY896_02880 [Gammaproteobacteria bacterium]|nr:hypothetical protein [Gammaproteobacteria bacterium]
MNNKNRPDLSSRDIMLLVCCVVIALPLAALWPGMPVPGSPSGQLSAALGAVLLLAPLGFVVMKRSGLSQSPPRWFIGHVLATSIGSCLIFVHVAAGNWFTPPGLVLLFLLFLVLQGGVLRAIFSRGFSLLFARSSAPLGFNAPATLDKTALQQIIDGKVHLLKSLDPGADEALFSPALKHWLGRPLSSLKYQLLAEREARMVGARASAGTGLGWSRRIHMLVALGFYLGLLAHIVVMLFFAGYAANGEFIDWWYVTAWGD